MKKAQSDAMSKFWVDHFIKDTVVDWDTFINAFATFVDKNYRVKLEEIQRNEVKRIVDPSNQQEIKVKNFNNFLEDYWILPTNREKLFKKHFKAVDNDYENGFKCVQFTTSAKEAGKDVVKPLSYTFKNDSLRQGNMSHPLKNKGFVNIGYSEQADITINNINLNPFHLKIFKHPLGYKFKDVSKSNRIRLSVTQPVLLRPGMVIDIWNYELSIVSLRLTPLADNSSYIDIPISEEPTEVQDTTLTFILKDKRNQEQKKYQINYKKQFRMGKDPSLDAVLSDVMAEKITCQLVYNRQNWFLQPKQKVEVYVASRTQIDKHMDSASVFIKTGMKVEFNGASLEFKLIKN